MAGKLIVIAAPSGCGKTTILKEVLKLFPNLYFSVSATTREKREYEENGKDYFFLSKEEFDKNLNENKFIEWNAHFGNKYGTLKSDIKAQIDNGNDIVFDLDVNGALNIRNYDPNAVLIFVKPPSIETLKERLIKRGTENEASLNLRLERAIEELAKSKYFDHIIINDNIDLAIFEMKNLIKSIIK